MRSNSRGLRLEAGQLHRVGTKYACTVRIPHNRNKVSIEDSSTHLTLICVLDCDPRIRRNARESDLQRQWPPCVALSMSIRFREPPSRTEVHNRLRKGYCPHSSDACQASSGAFSRCHPLRGRTHFLWPVSDQSGRQGACSRNARQTSYIDSSRNRRICKPREALLCRLCVEFL